MTGSSCSTTSGLRENGMQQSEFETFPPIQKLTAFKNFVAKYKVNPVCQTDILIAKDTSYNYRESDDAYILLLPLTVKECYLYMLPYVDLKRELTEYCIRIGKIEDLVPVEKCDNVPALFTFDGAKMRENTRLSKGARYVPFLSEYFDADKNKMLYKDHKDLKKFPRLIALGKRKYDSDKPEYQHNCGYVELQHNRVVVDDKPYGYVNIQYS